MNKIYDILKVSSPVAVELFASSWCNLNCTYCYIPKDNQMILDAHKQIIEDIKKVDPIINKIKNFYRSEDVTYMSHWGSEPSLTIEYFYDFYARATKEFPNLANITWSSNFIAYTDKVIDFILNFPCSDDRIITFDIQMSLDGPEWITDANRGKGSTQKIIKNLVHFFEKLNVPELKHKVNCNFKPTMSSNQYLTMLGDGVAYEYYQFFDDVYKKLFATNSLDKIKLQIHCDPTVVCAEIYTKESGINFANMAKKLYNMSKTSQFEYVRPGLGTYLSALSKAMNSAEMFSIRQSMFTCSAGDSQFGVGQSYLSPCHDLFYTPLEGYDQSLYQSSNRILSDVQTNMIKVGAHRLVKDKYLYGLDNDDQEGLAKFLYRLRGFHDFSALKLTSAVSMIKLLASCNQISDVYMDDDYAYMLAMFTLIRHSCPTTQIQDAGTIFIINSGYFKLFGNGLVEFFIEILYKQKNRFKK